MNEKIRVFSLAIILSCLLASFPLTSLAISQVKEGAVQQTEQPTQPEQALVKKSRDPFLVKWLHMLDDNEFEEISTSSVLAYAPEVPHDLARTFKKVGTKEGGFGFFGALIRSAIAIAVGFLIVFIVKRASRARIAAIEQMVPPSDEISIRFWTGILRSIPSFVGLFLLAITATIVFLGIAGGVNGGGRMLFQLLLGTILIFNLCSLIGGLVFSPKDSTIRTFGISDDLAKPLHKALTLSISLLASGTLIVRFVKELGARPQTVSWTIIFLGTAVIASYVILIIYLKTPVSNILKASVNEDKKSGWLKQQLASFWHIPALLYFFIIWFIWIGQEFSGPTVRNGSFFISLLIIPIYFGLNYVGKAIIESVIDSLGIFTPEESFDLSEEALAEARVKAAENRSAVVAKSNMIFRILLIGSLTTWIFSLWGYNIPFAKTAVRAIFESLVTLAIALLFWRFVSTYIQKKIEEATPEVEETEEDVDDEFGGAAPRGRSHTLLPMVRKVVATFLIVMVLMIVISSLGVNIGPLLAGAGVIGLAVGFGAQKLVSDVLSGFFFLLDDAFRVGEYIQAGSIRGTVESITLRNVMLRHHLGMLQVVPHSDLGAITNYMRGGIVIKFPLEFPYDTNIDQVRKIIKKVGQSMLEDEEIGEDFIQPLKSQGVNAIANSVMIIRVKFTAKPGKQFVIKREAFRRITEALSAKGIHYAHRKVLVDFPTDEQNADIPADEVKKALMAGAAATIAEEASQQQQLDDKEKQDTDF